MKIEFINKMESYNKLIASYKLAELFFDDKENIIIEEHNARVTDICSQLSELLTYFAKNNIKVEQHEEENGFNTYFRQKRFEKYGY